MPRFLSVFGLNLVPSAWARRTVSNAAWVYGIFVGAAAIVAVFLSGPSIGLVPSSGWPTVAAALALAPLCALVAYFVELTASRLSRNIGVPVMADGRSAEHAVTAVAKIPASYVALGTLTAVAEEVLFRGSVLPTMHATHGAVVAIAATAAIFAFHHGVFGVSAIVGKLSSGLLWGGLALVSGSLLAPLVAHLAFQALVYRRMARIS